jgi:hypothetical protein
MAKQSITPSSVTVTNIQALDDIVIGQAESLKTTFDKTGLDEKTYINNTLITELNGDNGSKKIGHDSFNLCSDNVADALEEVRQIAVDAQSGAIIDRSIEAVKIAFDTLTETEMANEMKKDITGGIASYDFASTQLLNSNLNLAKGLFTVQSQIEAGKQSLVDLVIDALNDASGINASASTFYQFDNTNKSVKINLHTKALLHFDGADTSTTFTDVTGRVWTANGNAQLDTAQKKIGTASALFDGTGDWIQTADSEDFNVGSGDFTLEYFVRRNTNGTTQYICGQYDGATDMNLFMQFIPTNTIKINMRTTVPSTKQLDSTTAITDTNWHHIVVERYGNTMSLYIDGVSEDSEDVTGLTFMNATTVFSIGRAGTVASNYFNGWIDEFRITKGSAKYMANFTPPTSELTLESAATVVWTSDTASTQPTDAFITVEETLNTGAIAYAISRDNGATYTTATKDVLADISAQPAGTTIVTKAEITGDAELNAIAWGWR